MHYCFYKLNGEAWRCQTDDTINFFCECKADEDGIDTPGNYFLYAFYINSEHKSHSTDLHLIDYSDGFWSEEDKSKKTDITDLNHFFKVCQEDKYLPLSCTVSSTHVPEYTSCSCAGEPQIDGQIRKFGSFNTSGMWNYFPCKITRDYTLFLKNQQDISTMTIWLTVLILLFLLLIIIFIIVRVKNKLFNHREVPITMSALNE